MHSSSGIFIISCFFLLSPVVIASCGVYRDKGDDLAAHLHIDLIDPVAQVFIVFRKHTVFCKQVLCKRCFPGFLLRNFLRVG